MSVFKDDLSEIHRSSETYLQFKDTQDSMTPFALLSPIFWHSLTTVEDGYIIKRAKNSQKNKETEERKRERGLHVGFTAKQIECAD